MARSDWKRARATIQKALRRDPGSHWLLTRLASTYYEQRDYTRALELTERATVLAPRCPLVLWDRASALAMLGRTREAMPLYRRIISRGIERLANGPCGEGLAWARGLHADALYRLSACYAKLGQHEYARRALERSIDERGPGCRSIYPLKQLRRDLKTLCTPVSSHDGRARAR